MFKRILIGIGVLALAVGAVLGIRSFNANRPVGVVFEAPQEAFIPNSELIPLTGKGLTLVDETPRLQLYVDIDTGNIQVYNKENGFIWRSCPTDEEMALDTSNTLWKNNLRSPVMFTYTTNYTSSDSKYGNTLSQETNINVFKMEKGARVYLEFLENKVTFGYDVSLQDDRLSVDIPSYLITEPGEVYKVSAKSVKTLDKKESCVLIDFTVFPSLGATRSDTGEKGYLFVPDGSGALMDFQSDKYINSQYIAHVYGVDFAIFNGYDAQMDTQMNKASIDYPVFGIQREGNTMMAVIDRGETQADIVASKARVISGFNAVNARFTYRMKYKVITNITKDVVGKLGENEGYLSYTVNPVKDARRLLYYFGTGGYVEMAAAYRGYLIEKYGLAPVDTQKQPPALQLYVSGGDTSTTSFGKSFIAMTTFEQAEEILAFFKENGVEHVNLLYNGWAKHGESYESPDIFPAEHALGGDKGLTALCQKADEMGYRVILIRDHLFLGTKRGVSLSRDTVYNVQNNPLFDGQVANTRFMFKMYEDSLKKYQQYGIDGLMETAVGWSLITDYSRSVPISREETKNAQRELIARMIDTFGSVQLDTCRVYGLMDGVTFTYMGSGSYLTILDETVPFYPIALHGLVDYYDGNYMYYHEPRKQLLEAISKGGLVSFVMTKEPTEKLLYSDWAYYYSSEFDVWKNDVLDLYNEMSGYMEKTRGRFITGYEKLKDGITLTRYEGGVSVLVNNTDLEYAYQGRPVKARSFLVLEGGDGQ